MAAADTDQQIFSIIHDPNKLNASTLSTSDKQAAKLFKPPEFITPYTARLNPHYSAQESSGWVREWLFGLKVNEILDDKLMEMMLKMDVPRLSAAFHPRAGEWGFRWACKYIFMLFIVDDIVDASFVGKETRVTLSVLLDLNLVMMWSFPDDPLMRRELVPFFNLLESGPERQERIDLFEGVLADARTHTGTVYPGPLSTVGNVFREIWTEAISNGALPEAMLVVAHYTQDWLSGVVMETEYKHGRTVPDCMNDIIPMRKKSSAVIPSLLITEVILENPLRSPASWIDSPEMQRMIDATNDLVTWHNDLWSFKKEVLQNDHIFNMVLAICRQNSVTYEEAGRIVIQMLNERLTDLEAATADLERATPANLRPNFIYYREACQNLVSGTIYWHSRSIRFQ